MNGHAGGMTDHRSSGDAVRIDRVRLLTIDIPLRFAFETSFGRWTRRRALLIIVEGGGLRGYGEVTAPEAPVYGYETVDIARIIIRDHLAPAILKAPVEGVHDVVPRMAFVRGHPMAKAGVEGACRDLMARRDGQSLREQLGGTRTRVDAGVSLGVEPTVEALLERVCAFAAAGYRRVKVKIRPGWDREPLARIRADLPDLVLAADANGAYSLADTDALAGLDDLELSYIEQPLGWDDLVDHAELARRIGTPICLDESLTGPAAARAALALGSARIWNIKLGRVGGAEAAVAIHDLARAAAVPVWCGGMLETCIGRLHNLALASLPGFEMPGDLSGTDRYFDVDLVSPAIRATGDGTLAVPDGPGLGAEVDEGLLADLAVDEVSVMNPLSS